MEKTGWDAYYDQTAERKPRPSILEAIEAAPSRDKVLDLGAGVMSDSQFLLDQGFNEVTAVDKVPTVEALAEEKILAAEGRLKVVIEDFTDFDFQENMYDLINAQYSLSFVDKENFDTVFERMKNSLKEGGVFVGTLFGDKDSWAQREDMTCPTRDEFLALLQGMEILKFDEEEREMVQLRPVLKNTGISFILWPKRIPYQKMFNLRVI